jgi:hypothetical protein
MKLTGEQSESEVSHDRVEIATMKELEVMEVPTESVLPQLANVTVTDVPAKLFENWFELETYTIVSANYTVTGKDYFTTLYNKISSLLDYKYRYYHADMELLFDINSTVFDYGSVGFIWNPSRITTISNFDPVNSNPYIFDISTGGTHIIKVPFSSVWEAYDSRRGSDLEFFISNRPNFAFINCYANTQAAALTSTVTVRARFCNFQSYGVINQVHNPFTEDEIELQSAMRNAVRGFSQAAAVLGTAGVIVNNLSNGVLPDPNDVNDVVGNVTSLLFDTKDQEESQATDGVMRNAPTLFGGMTDIKYKPTENFSLSNVRLPPRHLADPAMEHSIIKMAQIPCIVKQFDFVAGNSHVLNCAPLWNLEDSPGVYGYRVDYLAQVAQLFRYWSGSIDYKLKFHLSPGITAFVLIEVANFYGEPHTAWADTNKDFLYKKRVKITGAADVNIRVPYVANAPWAPTGARPDSDGTGLIQAPIPSKMNIVCERMSSALGGAAAVPHCYFHLIRSGGPDIAFRNLTGGSRRFIEDTPEPIELQSAIMMKVDSEYENICNGSHPTRYRETLENLMTIEDLCHRWSFDILNPSDSHDPLGYANEADWYDRPAPDLFYYLLGMFRYARGNVQYKVLVPDDAIISNKYVEAWMDRDYAFTVSTLPDVYESESVSQGAALLSSDLNPVFEFEAPIESYTDWCVVPTCYPATSYISENPIPLTWSLDEGIAAMSLNYYVRAGRAFQLAYLMPPLGGVTGTSWERLYPYFTTHTTFSAKLADRQSLVEPIPKPVVKSGSNDLQELLKELPEELRRKIIDELSLKGSSSKFQLVK